MQIIRSINSIIFILLLIIYGNICAASTGLPLPRFASLKANEVNLRSGPAHHYPIKFTYKCKNYPMEILAEFEHWRLISDRDGSQGWVHQSLLSGMRYAVIKSNDVYLKKLPYAAPKDQAIIFRLPDESSYPIARAEIGVIGRLKQCMQLWCQIEISDKRGWIKKSNLWGVYTDELFDK